MSNPGPAVTTSTSNLLAPNVVTANYTLQYGFDDKRVVAVQAAAGCTIKLPPATGTGVKYRIAVQTTVTSNNVIIQTATTGTETDTLQGQVTQTGASGATTSFGHVDTAGSQTNTITLNGSTKGGIIGDTFEFVDAGNGIWSFHGFTKITGTAATPLSHV